MSVTAIVKQILSWKDISSSAYVKSSDNSRTWAGTGDIDTSLNSGSTPAIDGGVSTLVTMTAGAATIDLTALTHQDSDTRSASGKKLRQIHFYNPSNNAIRVKTGASNGHIPYGANGFDVTIPPGGAFTLYLASAGIAITNSSNDTIDISGTTTDSLLMKAVWGA